MGGKCGICGDAYGAAVKEHEAPGGKYANGIIVAQYQTGQTIEVDIEITANHKGFFVFKLCENNNLVADKDQSCFEQHVLDVVNGDGKKYYVDTYNGWYKPVVKLPDGVTCSQCILQWDYTAGNSWGCDSPGDCGLGKGPQEHFRACADITISGENVGEPTAAPPAPTTAAPTTAAPTTAAPTTAAPSPTTTHDPNHLQCVGVAPWNYAGMDEWCTLNCNHVPKFCPATHCVCNEE